MPLTLTGKERRPPVIRKAMRETFKNGRDGSLEARPITPRPKPQDQMAVRTSITTEENRLRKPIKKRRHIPMPPDPPMTPGTIRRSWPGKMFALLENILDADIHQL